MKVIFLDMDGVLNNDTFLDDACRREPHVMPMNRWPGGHIDPTNVLELDRLVVATGARLVLSSAWRGHIELVELHTLLADRGYSGRDFYSQTPRLYNENMSDHTHIIRGREIQAWLDQPHPLSIESYVVLDDMGPHEFSNLPPARLVQTDPLVGLTAANVKRAIRVLNGREESGVISHLSSSL